MTNKPAMQEILKRTLRGGKLPKAIKTKKEQKTSPETPTLQVTQGH